MKGVIKKQVALVGSSTHTHAAKAGVLADSYELPSNLDAGRTTHLFAKKPAPGASVEDAYNQFLAELNEIGGI